jgi:hypothetical protein
VDREINTGKLSARSDREVHADQGLRSKLLALLMCYTPAWLKLGLETIFGECVTETQNVTPHLDAQHYATSTENSRRAASEAPSNRHGRQTAPVVSKPRTFLRRAQSVIPLNHYKQLAIQREKQLRQQKRAKDAPATFQKFVPKTTSSTAAPAVIPAPIAANGAGEGKKVSTPAETLQAALKRFITKVGIDTVLAVHWHRTMLTFLGYTAEAAVGQGRD